MINTAISASYRRDFNGLMDIRCKLVNFGANVLFPEHCFPINPDDDFIVLNTDQNDNVKLLQEKNLKLIEKCDFLYVFNPEGYIGVSTAMEIGYALREDIPVFCYTEPSDVTLTEFVTSIGEEFHVYLEQFKNRIAKKDFDSLDSLQEISRNFVKERGFEKETVVETMVLLQEELGELARSIRQYSNMKCDKGSKLRTLEQISLELSDCIKYLIIIANKFNISLSEAFHKKFIFDSKREWSELIGCENNENLNKIVE